MKVSINIVMEVEKVLDMKKISIKSKRLEVFFFYLTLMCTFCQKSLIDSPSEPDDARQCIGKQMDIYNCMFEID